MLDRDRATASAKVVNFPSVVFFPQLVAATTDAPAMTARHEFIVSDCAGPSYSLNEGAPVPQNDHLPAHTTKVTGGITETIELGRRVLELAHQLGTDTAPDRRRTPSFRLLAKQLVVPKGASSVWRAAAVYRLAERYPELRDYQHLGVGHLAVLLSLRGPVQLALLRKAERLRWSRRKLEAKVKRITEDKARGLDTLGPLLAELEAPDGASNVGSSD